MWGFLEGGCSFYIFIYFFMKKENFRKPKANIPRAHTHTHTLCSQIPISSISQFCSCCMEHSLCEVGALIPSPPLTPKLKLKVAAVHYFIHTDPLLVPYTCTCKQGSCA